MHPITHVELFVALAFSAVGVLGVVVGRPVATGIAVVGYVATIYTAAYCRHNQPHPKRVIYIRKS